MQWAGQTHLLDNDGSTASFELFGEVCRFAFVGLLVRRYRSAQCLTC